MASSSHYLKIDTVFKFGKGTIVIHAINKITISSSIFTFVSTVNVSVIV